jgi:hypothetical protein
MDLLCKFYDGRTTLCGYSVAHGLLSAAHDCLINNYAKQFLATLISSHGSISVFQSVTLGDVLNG